MNTREVPASPPAPAERDEIAQIEKRLASGDAIPAARLLAWLESDDETQA